MVYLMFRHECKREKEKKKSKDLTVLAGNFNTQIPRLTETHEKPRKMVQKHQVQQSQRNMHETAHSLTKSSKFILGSCTRIKWHI